MDQESLSKTYGRYAKWYDYTFGAIINPGRKKVIEKLSCKPHEKVLEVGVGTGLSLPLYPKNIAITGIDFSNDMLDIAKERIMKHQLTNIELLEMNAEQMQFPDNTFDKVVALYVASVVPNPDRLVAEMERVCKPGGELFIVNHFYSTNPFMSTIESITNPLLAKFFGFQPCVKLDDFIAKTKIQIAEQAKVNIMGNWTFLRILNTKDAPLLKNSNLESEINIKETASAEHA